MPEALLAIRDLEKHFGAVSAADNVNLTVYPGEIHAIIGPNGAGKTTLINLIAGELSPDAGTVMFEGTDITALPIHQRAQLGLARTFQITNIFNGFSSLDNVALAVQACAGHSFRFWRDARRISSLRDPARRLLRQVGLEGREHAPALTLSHGDQRRVAIAMALATRPKLLLLDEPMAGMGAAATRDIMALLGSLRGRQALLLVEHDMDVVFSLADRISVLVYGRIVASGTPDDIRTDAVVLEAYLGEEADHTMGDASKRLETVS